MPLRRVLQISGILLAIIVCIGVFVLITEYPTILATESKKQPTVGFVDIQLIFQQHPEKFRAEQILHEEARRMQAELEAETVDLSGAEKQALLEKYQWELQAMEQELINSVVEKIDTTVYEVAQLYEVTVVLESKNVIYGGQDLTRPVLARIREAGQSAD